MTDENTEPTATSTEDPNDFGKLRPLFPALVLPPVGALAGIGIGLWYSRAKDHTTGTAVAIGIGIFVGFLLLTLAGIGPARINRFFAESETGGQTYFDRYVAPLMVPLLSVGTILLVVINLSRILISGETSNILPLLVASLVTVGILVGATALSAAPKMRTHTLALALAGVLGMVLVGGFLTVGHSQEKGVEVAAKCEPSKTKLKVVAQTSLKFDAKAYAAATGCVEIDYSGASGHTLVFDPPGPAAPKLYSDSSGEQAYSWTLTPGTYKIWCDISGHRAAGMEATLTVK